MTARQFDPRPANLTLPWPAPRRIQAAPVRFWPRHPEDCRS